MAHEKPQNDDGLFDPHPGDDLDNNTKQPDDQNQPPAHTDQTCALAVDTTIPNHKGPLHDKQEKNHPE